MPDDKKDKKYWYDQYAPKKHSKGYWRGRYQNTILRDPEYYLEHYGRDGKTTTTAEARTTKTETRKSRSGRTRKNHNHDPDNNVCV